MDVTFPTSAAFRADQGRRLISGLLVQWDKPARSGDRWFVFKPGSLHWSDVSRVKLNRNHVAHDAVGVAVSLDPTPTGLSGVFRVASGNVGDEVLTMAAERVVDGFSVEVDFEDGDKVEHSAHILEGKRVHVVHKGTLRGVACTANPSFDDARITSVAASRDGRLEIRLEQDLEDGVKMAADRAGVSVSELVRGQLRHYVSMRPTYSLDGSGGPSLVNDLWVKNHPSEGDAYEAGQRIEAHRQFLREMGATFATATRATDPEIIPPGYQPLVTSSDSDRPLYDAASHGDLTTPTPFTIPAIVDETAVDTGVAAHVEGTNPTEGTLSMTGKTITPVSVSGKFSATREIATSSNPAVDVVVHALMREDFDRQVETMIYTELNGSGGQGGTITGDFVPSGAAVRTSTGATLPADVRKALGLFVDHRKQKPRSVVASSRKAVAEALETLDMGAWALRDVTVDCRRTSSAPRSATATCSSSAETTCGCGSRRCWSSRTSSGKGLPLWTLRSSATPRCG